VVLVREEDYSFGRAEWGLKSIGMLIVAHLGHKQCCEIFIKESSSFQTRKRFSAGRLNPNEKQWLDFLDTVRTERFDQVLALRPILATILMPCGALTLKSNAPTLGDRERAHERSTARPLDLSEAGRHD
jgi:hypothetical protein